MVRTDLQEIEPKLRTVRENRHLKELREAKKNLNVEESIIHSILVDDLKSTASLLEENPDEFPLLTELLDQVREKALPLAHLKSNGPDFVVFFPSYTCGVGCQMCSTGFSNKTQLYENYLFMTPEQFDSCMPWVQNSSFVIFCGLGETLDSPHMIDFLAASSLNGNTPTC